MPSRNECFMSGHIARPIEVKESKSGKPWGKLTIAVTTGKKPKESVAWVQVTLFGDVATEASRYGKGDIAEFEKLQYQTNTLENQATGEKKTFHGFTLPPWGKVTWTKKGEYKDRGSENKHATGHSSGIPTHAFNAKEPDSDVNLPF